MPARDPTDECFFATFSDRPCDGPTDPCHLVPKQRIKRELRSRGISKAQALDVIWDSRLTVPGCRRHHGDFDSFVFRVPREAIPVETFRFVESWGLSACLDRDLR